MFNFFAYEENKKDSCYYITGSDYNHIKNVLSMQEGDTCLVSCDGQSDLCRINSFSEEFVCLEIAEENYTSTELPVKIYLFQGLPKSDKMELIIQKCVELGVSDITPVEMSRCVVKLEEKKKVSLAKRFIAQFSDFCVIILFVACIISFATGVIEGKGDFIEPIVILAIVILNAVIGVYQESRAEKAIDALRKLSAPSATVKR